MVERESTKLPVVDIEETTHLLVTNGLGTPIHGQILLSDLDFDVVVIDPDTEGVDVLRGQLKEPEAGGEFPNIANGEKREVTYDNTLFTAEKIFPFDPTKQQAIQVAVGNLHEAEIFRFRLYVRGPSYLDWYPISSVSSQFYAAGISTGTQFGRTATFDDSVPNARKVSLVIEPNNFGLADANEFRVVVELAQNKPQEEDTDKPYIQMLRHDENG